MINKKKTEPVVVELHNQSNLISKAIQKFGMNLPFYWTSKPAQKTNASTI
jgi:hypothetical protein